ncbi:MAG: Asp-tRNA(Asn)/Glu-tRNA(Gln) amidotransferase subunit GatB, partial [Actinobacteria bacterium]|nr:Asp-tRNA(Asn)/Glu-tRNA(Gln) amidotransferase subunit GatB [Actinomycetota bacterium]MSY47678.1 Asp-tRNA(Asn)/Glu-tRNA(Gln) amidotransferase subunit GatB [Actinomycetota bacterium]MTA65418.1 Asp-tRNA(Asn)/Glu-tRNA(Gln) amidotransferase subunit GatB [Actinomycetota bacterium]
MSEVAALPNGWQLIVGLEVHVELATKTKMFSASANRFGDEPNTNIDPVTLGLPGALPVLNKHAIELAMRIGLALNCKVQPCTFHRKNYFYPDLPKAFQITQYDHPLNIDGHLMLPGDVRIGIERAHLEEDTGKSTHFGGASGRIHGSDYSLIDFNRAGVPLVEIVSRPDIRTSEQARQYVAELRSILLAVGASDAKMEEGSMRCDVNVSVHKPGTPFGTRCEIKNVNSIRSVGRAIDYESRRQVDLIESGGTIRQETRHWDDSTGRTETLRTKEDADDYRYFLEPDLVPLVPDPAWIEAVRAALPVLPAARRQALAELCGVDKDGESAIVVVERGQDDYVREVISAGGDARRAVIYVQQAFAEQGASPKVSAKDLAALTVLERDAKVTSTQAKTLLTDLIEAGGGDVLAMAAKRGFEALDTSAVEAMVDAAIAAEPGAWQKYCSGEEKALGALVGAVMKSS